MFKVTLSYRRRNDTQTSLTRFYILISYFLLTGGAISNLYGMLCARHNKFPEVKSKGMTNTEELVVFTSTNVSTHEMKYISHKQTY